MSNVTKYCVCSKAYGEGGRAGGEWRDVYSTIQLLLMSTIMPYLVEGHEMVGGIQVLSR